MKISSEPENSDSEWEGESGDDIQSDDSSHSQSCTKSTKSSKSTCVPKTMRDKFIRSLQTFRNREPPSEREKRALELFYHIPRGVPKKDMIKMMKDAGITADAELIRRVHSKVKGAAADYLNYS